ncbi:MAG TPA: C39 family peptidase, partial [Deinococcales bacterium]|nr:C39 family peptidase [Deinococcales bacterium]
AGRGPLRAYLALLPGLRAAEAFLASGRPLAASVAWQDGQLPGAPLPASGGHLLVVRGFAPNGDVIVNDPAAPSDLEVRRAYPRGAFERQWLGHSLGLVYVIEPVED